MIELRWCVQQWTEYPELGEPIKRQREPVLQFRQMTNIQEIGIQEPIWSDWVEVPTVYEDENNEL